MSNIKLIEIFGISLLVCLTTGDPVWNSNYDMNDVLSEREMEYLLLRQQQDVSIIKVDTKWLKYMIGELKNKTNGLDTAVHRISRSATQMLRENKELADKIYALEKAAVVVPSYKLDKNLENELLKKKNHKYYYTKQENVMPSDLRPRTNTRYSSPSFDKYANKYAQLNRPAADQPMLDEEPLATVVEKGVIKLADIPSPAEKEHEKLISVLQNDVSSLNDSCVTLKKNLNEQQALMDEVSMNVEVLKDKNLAIVQRLQRLEQGFESIRKDMRSERNKNKAKMRKLEKRIDEIDPIIFQLLSKIKD